MFESDGSGANLNEGLQLGGVDRCLVMARAEQERCRGVQGSCLPLQGRVGFLPTVREEVVAQARERATKRKTDALPAGQVARGGSERMSLSTVSGWCCYYHHAIPMEDATAARLLDKSFV
jgi:hypothetical protein